MTTPRSGLRTTDHSAYANPYRACCVRMSASFPPPWKPWEQTSSICLRVSITQTHPSRHLWTPLTLSCVSVCVTQMRAFSCFEFIRSKTSTVTWSTRDLQVKYLLFLLNLVIFFANTNPFLWNLGDTITIGFVFALFDKLAVSFLSYSFVRRNSKFDFDNFWTYLGDWISLPALGEYTFILFLY